ncbi:cell cycle checkpoint [Punctularia strigosozonata HHB-11173 SS5]|uniref:cell cycle checkpoint n=1 Tax=Punctularia strigosozonata (strain HHB-11173) TaxID=741275 RepID=UPI0004416C0A|nr:cell cycle checkpoint [Punctularia strigosozonata HHB-11173 SS5]EIN08739.1 cell cycle checkpoint [Punctularia strigosozonata HHB-11173 SS5]
MRFRATVDSLPTFSRIIQSIEKLQKKCIIKFTEPDIYIICNNDVNEGGVQVWSQIRVSSIFTDYRIQSNSNNEITMSIATEPLLAVLRGVSSSIASMDHNDIVMKLAKKDDRAVLQFEIAGFSRSAKSITLAHHVPIEVMKPSDVAKLKEPTCPEPDIHLILPSLTKLRTVIERLRPMAEILTVSANRSGDLQLGVETDTVNIKTAWSKLVIPDMDHQSSQDPAVLAARNRDPKKMHSVNVSVRSFQKFLNSHVVSSTTIACLCARHCMILYVYIGDVTDAGGVLTFYLPAILND